VYESVDGLAVELDRAVLRLTLDRADRRNALTDAMVLGLIDAVSAAEQDERVRAIVVTANGEHFCSGADIVARNAPGGSRPRVGSIQRRVPHAAHRLIPLICSVQVPVVVIVRGWVAGIGMQIALAADFTIAASDARFWEPFIERGFTPDSGATWLLTRRVGVVRARDLLLLGRQVTGAEAAEWGMIHAAVDPDALDAEGAAIVDRLAALPTVAAGLTKWLLHEGEAAVIDDQLRREAFALELSSRSEDFREGLAAFKEKRPPSFEGR
jgi:2-(1,2-epoxy-1,2-dihydrophenyl)acetyl-CoA isomerase